MSKSAQRRIEKKEQEVIEQLHGDFEPWTKSRQARYHSDSCNKSWSRLEKYHNDGERMYKDFGLTPMHKALAKESRKSQRYGMEDAHPVYRYPSAYLDALIHIDDAEKWALEDGRTDDPIIAEQPRPRRKVLEWLARPENGHVLDAMGDGGTDLHAHSEPGEGKTSLANMIGGVRMPEVNNETVLWYLTLDELECLPLAPFMTVAVPAGVEIEVEAKPRDHRLPDVEIDLTDVFRDTISYDSPRDLMQQIVPGGLYAVLPDPLFRGCEKLTTATYTPAREAEEPAEVTPLRDNIFAMVTTRAKDDEFLHPTTAIIDEAGDLLPLNPEADENDTNRKVKEYPKVYGKARKKNFSALVLSHSVARIDEGVREKERWFVTMPNTPAPSSTLSGIGKVPIKSDYAMRLSKGEAVVWRNQHFCEISWPNPYRRYEFRGEVSIRYPTREVALDAL
ncbi:hypothetical protein VB773_14255 [Haloarculaceae archaeon H-GB2-1]|nr:hypothetical protein [Haloarculaceae archaeon H-GB1-1]MEA5408618.1 hypothetical protein [Haloarculaceae archaeon H-GB2-1]